MRRLALHYALIRKRAQLTQAQLGEWAEIEQTYVSRVERGKGKPSMWLLKLLAEGLGVSGWEILRMGEDLLPPLQLHKAVGSSDGAGPEKT